MKKLLLLGLLALGGCADLQALGTAYQLTTASVANPVTPTVLYKVESGAQIAITALQAYKKACVAGSADANCRGNVAAIQVYTRQLPLLLAQLRSFVRNNDQVNATVIYNQVVALITNFKAAATTVGINTGA